MPWGPWPDGITTSQLVTAAWLTKVSDSLAFMEEVAYAETTSDTAITATTVGTANQIVTSGSITYENVPHIIQFGCPALRSSTGQCFLILRDSTTVLGTLFREVASGDAGDVAVFRRITPSAASHSYNVAGWLSAAGTWQASGGSGGTAGDGSTYFASFIRILRIPT